MYFIDLIALSPNVSSFAKIPMLFIGGTRSWETPACINETTLFALSAFYSFFCDVISLIRKILHS